MMGVDGARSPDRHGHPRVHRHRGIDEASARAYVEQAYRLHRELDEPTEVATDVLRFAEALAGVGRAEAAVELASLSEALREELGARIPWVERKSEETL